MKRTALAVARDHPAYEGHFPSRPILPAVVLLAEVTARIAASAGSAVRDWRVAHAKFTRAVAPGAALELAHEDTDGARVRFEVHGPEGVVAEGQLARAERA